MNHETMVATFGYVAPALHKKMKSKLVCTTEEEHRNFQKEIE